MMHPVLKACGCSPTAYDGGSLALVHSPSCETTPEAYLTREEQREWKAQCRAIATLHPVLARPPAIENVVPFPIPKEYWHLDSPTDGCDRDLRADGIHLVKHKPSRRPKAGI